MSHYRCISPQQAQQLLQNEAVTVADIRDPQSFSSGHIPHAIRLDNQSLPDFIASTPNDRPVLVVCYHGHSSQNAAAYLASQGYTEVYSLDGGFEQWRSLYPEQMSQKD
jgi:thiosulfate sulfurtransferase